MRGRLRRWLDVCHAARRGNLDRNRRTVRARDVDGLDGLAALLAANTGKPVHLIYDGQAIWRDDTGVPVGRGPRWCANPACRHHHEQHVVGVCQVPGCACLNVSVAVW